ncbi:TMV resistance protein N-like [Rosa rugosa]|uniref:TMV resistance protein N-like n=1 Tax=Rosa rugosa TaxID=74645 RepID=UPI002B403EA5|nr:TMV resistance protein N-like [Rosa rugosa]
MKNNRGLRFCRLQFHLFCILSFGRYEADFIDTIVGDIWAKLLTRTHLKVAKYPVGVESRVKDMLKLLRVGENDVCMVGIWGIGGIGKTTIAKAVYNSIADKFEGTCFLENVKEPHGGLVQLQNLLLSEILGVKELNMNNVDLGVNVIRERLSNKRVLIVVDDVNDSEQLSKLVGNTDWFGSGSRIIITTRDKHLLTAHDINQVYELKELSHCEALELFKLLAFKEKINVDDYTELMKNVILYAQGVPLVLEVMGSDLRGKHVDQWKDALDSYAKEPSQEIHKKLKISYEALQESMKEVFLHIACFFKGQKKEYVIDILEGCGLNPKIGIQVLTEKALINITEADSIQMHDLLEEMGKEIVRQESPNQPGERSRLWRFEDVYRVFVENTGTDKIKGIMVKDGRLQQIPLRGKSFLKLKNLQIFMIMKDIFYGDYVDSLPDELRLIHWEYCPLQSFPPGFDLTKIVLLDMPRSRTSPLGQVQKILFGLKMPWSSTSALGKGPKIIPNLKSINLSRCRGLRKICDFSRFPNLVNLSLQGCGNLVEVDPSIGYLKNLVNLDLGFCKKLSKFEIVGEMTSLKSLDLRESGIKTLPASVFGYPINLEKLTLAGCYELCHVSSCIFELQHLRHLDLRSCHKLVTFPAPSKSGWISSSEWKGYHDSLFVDLKNCWGLKEIFWIERKINHLNLSGCRNLEIISPSSLRTLPVMNLSGCERLYSDSKVMDLLLSGREGELEVILTGSRGVLSLGNDIFEGYNFCIKMKPISWPLTWMDGGLAFFAEWKTSAIGSFRVYVNGQCISVNCDKESYFFPSSIDDHVWLYYVPFPTIESRLGLDRLPDMLRVRFDFNHGNDEVENCWIQVVQLGAGFYHEVHPIY